MSKKAKCKYCLGTGWVPSDIGGRGLASVGIVAEIACSHCDKGRRLLDDARREADLPKSQKP